jgi:hypothetical protein
MDWHAEEAIARLPVGGSSTIGLFSTFKLTALTCCIPTVLVYGKFVGKQGLFSRQAQFMKYRLYRVGACANALFHAQTVLKEALFCAATQSSDNSTKQWRNGHLIEQRSPIE